ncbi:hypothetical protein D3C87_1339190 [compost metagenome]
MADHRHYAGNRATLGDRLGYEYRQMCVAREVTGTANAVHHPRATHVGGVDVAINVELERRVDADDAEATYHFRVVGNLLRAQDQLVLVAFQVAEHIGVTAARQCDRAARGKAQFTGVDQIEGRVLKHFGVHRQVFERRIDQAAHHRVGDRTDPGLQRTELVGHAPGIHFLFEEADQVVGNGLSINVRGQHGGWRVGLIGDHDRDDFFRWNRDGRAANAIVDLDQWNRRAGRAIGRNIDVVQAFEIRVVREVDLNDHLFGKNREAGRVAHGSGRHDMALFGDGYRFDHRNVRQLQLLVAQLLDGFREVLVDEHHFTGVDRLAQSAIHLEWHAS